MLQHVASLHVGADPSHSTMTQPLDLGTALDHGTALDLGTATRPWHGTRVSFDMVFVIASTWQ
jgi:hypothetical protein